MNFILCSVQIRLNGNGKFYNLINIFENVKGPNDERGVKGYLIKVDSVYTYVCVQ